MWWNILKKTVSKIFSENLFQHSAALAFYTLFSLAPTVIIAIAISGVIFGKEAAHGAIVGQIRGLIGIEPAKTIEEIIRNASLGEKDVWATLIGLILLLVGSTTVFGQLKSFLNQIWDVEGGITSTGALGRIKSFLKNYLLSFLMVLAIGFLLLTSIVFSTLFTSFSDLICAYTELPSLLLQAIHSGFSLLLITGLFAMIFKFLPDSPILWNHVWIGAAATSALFSLGKYLIALYIAKNSLVNVYGIAGSLIVILLWVYYSSFILFSGAVFTNVYADAIAKENSLKKSSLHVNQRIPQ